METYIVEDENLCGLGGICRDCGSVLADYLCNDSVIEQRPEADYEDYWLSCTNKDCINHYGEGYLQSFPEWVVRK